MNPFLSILIYIYPSWIMFSLTAAAVAVKFERKIEKKIEGKYF